MTKLFCPPPVPCLHEVINTQHKNELFQNYMVNMWGISRIKKVIHCNFAVYDTLVLAINNAVCCYECMY